MQPTDSSHPEPLFVPKERGVALMTHLGFVPEPSLADVQDPQGHHMHGYLVPARDRPAAIALLAEKQVYCFESPPEPLALPRAADRDNPERYAQRLQWSSLETQLIGWVVDRYMDVLSTDMNRASFYNTKQQQRDAADAVHRWMFATCRQLYALLPLLPGTTEYSKMEVIYRLLRRPPRQWDEQALDLEETAIGALIDSLTPPRRLRLFDRLRAARVNNRRTRRWILTSLLDNHKLAFHSVKYRRKMRRALVHAIGVRRASITASILKKKADDRTDRETAMLDKWVLRFSNKNHLLVEDCVGFILGNLDQVKHPLLVAYSDARRHFNRGKKLPPEVLEGLRSTFHPHRSPEEVLALATKSMTRGQQIGWQRRAEESGVKVAFNPMDHDPIRLYLYAFERGMDPQVQAAINAKARAIAGKLPVSLPQRTGILLDASGSMAGGATQRYRPIATALAIRDVLNSACFSSLQSTVGGREQGQLVHPEGPSSLALELINLLRQGAEQVFILSDGYENSPAGRVAEVIRALPHIGFKVPIVHLNPVLAAEASGSRQLAPGYAPTVPVSSPTALGFALMRALVRTDPRRGVAALTLHIMRETPQIRRLGEDS